MAIVKSGEISSNQASEIQSRVFNIRDEVSRIISALPLAKAEELLQYCRDFAAGMSR